MWKKFVAGCGIAVLVHVSGMPASSATESAARKCPKPASIVVTTSWENTDPQYAQFAFEVAMQNCRGAIRKIDVVQRVISPNGGLESEAVWPQVAVDVVRKANGSEDYIGRQYLVSDLMFQKWGLSSSKSFYSPMTSTLKSCTQAADGSAVDMTGYTFYVIVKASNKAGTVILEQTTPPMPCGQGS